MSNTANMTLVLPTVSVTIGPTYATQINTALDLIDSHDHSSGKGVKVTPTGLNINTNLSFGENDAYEMRSLKFEPQTASLAEADDVESIYSVNGSLYYNNDAGDAVQITSGSGLNLSSTGTIGGDYAQSGVEASVTYSNTTKVYSFLQSSGIAGKIACSDLSLSYPGSGEQAVTLKAPTGTTAYSLTLPGTGPTTNDSVMAITSSGTSAYKAISGTANQITVTSTGTGLTFGFPQDVTFTRNISTDGYLRVTDGVSTGFRIKKVTVAVSSGNQATATLDFSSIDQILGFYGYAPGGVFAASGKKCPLVYGTPPSGYVGIIYYDATSIEVQSSNINGTVTIFVIYTAP